MNPIDHGAFRPADSPDNPDKAGGHDQKQYISEFTTPVPRSAPILVVGLNTESILQITATTVAGFTTILKYPYGSPA